MRLFAPRSRRRSTAVPTRAAIKAPAIWRPRLGPGIAAGVTQAACHTITHLLAQLAGHRQELRSFLIGDRAFILTEPIRHELDQQPVFTVRQVLRGVLTLSHLQAISQRLKQRSETAFPTTKLDVLLMRAKQAHRHLRPPDAVRVLDYHWQDASGSATAAAAGAAIDG